MNVEEKVMVSISCATYNHEKYIAEAIEGFLIQKTNFKFEVLIHDDASTDRTADIIRSYQEKHPEIIKPIYQTENQYSKNVKIGYVFNYPRAKGKYIAFCEGDDYWIDPYKLQKQVEYMEENPDCTFCFHNAFIANDTNGVFKKNMIPGSNERKRYFSNKSRKYMTGELQLLGFIPTASFLIPKKILTSLPEWYFTAPAGDIAVKLIAASHGYAYYINENMSVYRVNVKGSSTNRWKKDDVSKKMARIEGFINTLDAFDKWSEYKYTDEVDESKKSFEFRLELNKKNKDVFSEERYREYFKKMSLCEKFTVYVKLHFPDLIKVLDNITPLKLKYRLIR